MFRAGVTKLFSFGCLVCIFCSVAAARSYDTVVDELITLAQLAAQAHNDDSPEKAMLLAEKVKSRFDEALVLDSEHPQAYLSYGTFLSNSNRFTEAIPHLKKASSLVGGDSKARSQIAALLRRSEYGMYSMLRDDAYQEGAGDVYAAVGYAEKQLDVSPHPPVTQHELATLYAMLCEYDVSACETASSKFRIASHAAYQTYQSLRIHEHFARDERQMTRCRNSQLHIGSWARHRSVSSIALVPHLASSGVRTAAAPWGQVFFFTVTSASRLVGADGLILVEGTGDCTVLSPSSDHYLNVAQNLGVPHRRDSASAAHSGDNAPIHTVPVLSLMQLAAASYYHWIAEVIPRLVLAMSQLDDAPRGRNDNKIRIIVPRVSKSTRFIVATFELLFPEVFYELVEYVPGTRSEGTLHYVSWERQTCPPSVTGSMPLSLTDARECPALAHPYALHRARLALRSAVEKGPFGVVKNAPGTRLVIVARRGDSVTMRRADEYTLIQRLRAMLRRESAVLGPTELQVFDASSYTFEESLALFKRASVVVGVHGGALANIVVCAPNTTIIEIGFRADSATHYQHLAYSLGMIYRRVRVTRDALGRSVAAPVINYNIDDAVDAVMFSLGDWSEDPKRRVADVVMPATNLPWASLGPLLPSAFEPDEL